MNQNTCKFQTLLNKTINGFLFSHVLGTGSFATVFAALETTTATNFAIKSFIKKGLSASQLDSIEREADLLFTLKGHKNIVQIHSFFETDDFIFLVLNKSRNDLFETITSMGPFSHDHTKFLFLQVVDAVAFAHSKGVYHRDLKPENILVSCVYCSGECLDSSFCRYQVEGLPYQRFLLQLADFGLATTSLVSSEFGCGSVRYMSPELLNASKIHQNYSSVANDVWAIGVLLVNLLFQKNPWHEASDKDIIYSQFSKSNPRILAKQFNLSSGCEKLFGMIFHTIPHLRPTLAEIRRLVVDLPSFTREKIAIRIPMSPISLPSSSIAQASPISFTPQTPHPNSALLIDTDTMKKKDTNDIDSAYSSASPRREKLGRFASAVVGFINRI